MKKIMTILMCCAFVLCVGNAAIADDDIVKRHDNWVKKTVGAGQAVNRPTASGVRVLNEEGVQNKEHTIAIMFRTDPESKKDVKTLQIGSFTLHLVNLVDVDGPKKNDNIYIYTFKGDPGKLAKVIDSIMNPFMLQPKTDPSLEVVKMPDEKGILPGGCYPPVPRGPNYVGRINNYNLKGDFLLKLSPGTQLEYILKHYDVSLIKDFGNDWVYLEAKDPKAAAHIMNGTLKKGLAEYAELNRKVYAYAVPVIDNEHDRKIAVEQEVALQFKNKQFTGQMAGEPKEVIPLQKKN